MSRRLLLLNVCLAGASLASVVYVARQVMVTTPAPPARTRAASASAVPAPPAAVEAPPAPGSYTVVASRNLFSPTRTEAPPGPGAAGAGASPLPKPNLYGVVLREGAPIAYLEDPTTKRVAGYRTGDAVAGGTVQVIAADHVVLARPDGRVEVRLHDPAKPRAQAPLPGTPGQPARPPASVQQPGAARFPDGMMQQGQVAIPLQPPAVTQSPLSPGRRPLPPNLRRVLPGTIPDAAQQ